MHATSKPAFDMNIAEPLTVGEISSEHSTTNGAVAIRNLDAQIAGWQAADEVIE